MKKKELRQLYLKERMAMSREELHRLSLQIFENFLGHFSVRKGQKIHLFLTLERRNEVDTSFFLNLFFKIGVRVFVPKVVGDKLISAEIKPGSELAVNRWGIKEPKSDTDENIREYDYILTPVLYCDQHGNRVGYGKGFYDGLFAQVDSRCPKIGLNFFAPKETVDDLNSRDVPLDYLVTPMAVLSFDRSSKETK